MTTDDSGRSPETGGPPEEDDDTFRWPTASDSPAEVGRTAVRGLFAAMVGRMMFFHSLVPLFLGGGFLIGAWTLAHDEMVRRESLATFSGRAPGTIEAPFWRLESDLEILGDGTNWLAVTTASACAHLRFRPEDGEERTTVYCRRFPTGISSETIFTWAEAWGPVPVRRVDARGMPRFELRLPRDLVRWLDEQGPEINPFYNPNAFHGPEAARRVDRLLGTVWRDLDDPFLRLLEEWSKPAPAVTVAYPPDDPARAAPLPLLQEQFTLPAEGAPMPGWVLAAIIGFFGTVCWAIGCYLLTLGNRWVTAVLVVAGLAVVPWGSRHAGDVLGFLWDDAEMALDFILSEMLALPPELVLAAPAGEDDRDIETVAWTLESSTYAGLLRWIDLRPPPEPMDPDGVLRHLADQVTRQALALPDEELAELLAWATAVQERGGGEEIGLLFVDAALDLADDETRSDTVRGQAERLLGAVAFHPPSDNPYRLAVAERGRILARLPRR